MKNDDVELNAAHGYHIISVPQCQIDSSYHFYLPRIGFLSKGEFVKVFCYDYNQSNGTIALCFNFNELMLLDLNKKRKTLVKFDAEIITSFNFMTEENNFTLNGILFKGFEENGYAKSFSAIYNKPTHQLQMLESPDNAWLDETVGFLNEGKAFYSMNSAECKAWNLSSLSPLQHSDNIYYYGGKGKFIKSPGDYFLHFVNHNNVRSFKLGEEEKKKIDVSFLIDGKRFYSLLNIDIQRGKVYTVINPKYFELKDPNAKESSVLVWNMEGKVTREIKIKRDGWLEMSDLFQISPEGNRYLVFDEAKGNVEVYNAEKDEKILSRDLYDFAQKDEPIFEGGFQFSPDGNYLAIFFNKVYGLYPHKQIDTSGFKKIEIYKLEEKKLINRISAGSEVSSVAFSHDNKSLAVAYGHEKGNEIDLLDWETGKIVKKYRGHTNAPLKMEFNKKEPLLMSYSELDGIKMWNLRTDEEIFQLTLTRGDKLNLGDLFFTPDGYYLAEKEALKSIKFRYGYRALPAEQFDIRFNRPDKVLERLPGSDQAMIKKYHKAYEKRCEKFGIENDTYSSMDLPEVNVFSPELYESGKNSITLNISAISSDSKLTSLHILINNVPLHGMRGIHLKDRMKIDTAIVVILSPKENAIEVFVRSVNGKESLKSDLLFNYKGTFPKPVLYFVGIGISKYENLRGINYADKDINDFITALTSKKGKIYENIIEYVYLNEDAVKDSIMTIKQKLLHTNTNDYVVFYYSGHGSLTGDKQYCLTTYDFDVNDTLSVKLTPELIGEMLDSIPARNKACIINACNSGENDSDFETLEEMRRMFYDLRGSPGMALLASSARYQAALSGKGLNWPYGENTLLGHVLLKILGNNKNLTITDFFTKVQTEVIVLTDGDQKPELRLENPKNNFRIW
jgi:WD40 repeat protein